MDNDLFGDLLVIDCASFIAGPTAATIMADFGARVIKIEPPNTGDGYRLLVHLPGLPNCESNYPWSLTNRSKESLALDLKHADGQRILAELVGRADVFITNYPLPIREKLGVSYAHIRPLNDRLIYASLTPYGETGPEASKTGYDATAWWARSGLMDTVRASADTPPAISVPGMGDHMAANTLFGAIASALYRRERTGKGAMVGTSLFANGLWSNGVMVQAALEGANMSARLDSSKMSAFTRTYKCKDDRWFILTVLPQVQDRVWPELLKCIGREDLLNDARFTDNGTRNENKIELAEIFNKAFETKDWATWEKDFEQHDITCGVIAKTQDIISDKQAHAANMLISSGPNSDSLSLDNPYIFADVDQRPPAPAPQLGEHSAAILSELGLEQNELKILRDQGVIGMP
jgi:crotonobetainyl-CoA:carnitine CoA-transferase CaiB-like acyl-CoA transferase